MTSALHFRHVTPFTPNCRSIEGSAKTQCIVVVRNAALNAEVLYFQSTHRFPSWTSRVPQITLSTPRLSKRSQPSGIRNREHKTGVATHSCTLSTIFWTSSLRFPLAPPNFHNPFRYLRESGYSPCHPPRHCVPI